ncbi:hypothetical protein [Bosea vaviloviae]|uniref:hypothetical protein n=1 Tax=Bosea vaviloviae TaxID=1526658 RepID=UPI001FCE29FA|nr:hypothetical protein [Bosea vaviloviae]
MVGDRQRLALVMRDHDGADPQFEDQLADPEARLLTQLGIEIRQRLVQQQHLGS